MQAFKRRKTSTLANPPSKKRKVTSEIEEITFDFSAREDYLTGFHKRKLQRIKHAQEEGAKKEKKLKIEARKQLRESRKADLEKHVQEVNALLRKAQSGEGVDSGGDEGSEEEDWAGIEEPTIIDDEAEYIDEDKHTTVTIEAVDVDKEGLHKTADGLEEDEEPATALSQKVESKGDKKGKRVWTKEKPEKPKPKKKKFRYESKADRKGTRLKERSKNKAQAKARRE